MTDFLDNTETEFENILSDCRQDLRDCLTRSDVLRRAVAEWREECEPGGTITDQDFQEILQEARRIADAAEESSVNQNF
jgi:hypothetical protein